MSVLWLKRGWIKRGGQALTALERILALSPSLLVWPEKGAGWQGTSGGDLAAVGQPLGLGVDLSQLEGKTLDEWLATTPELVTNGDFDTDSDWTHATIGTATAASISGGQLNLPRTDGSNFSLSSQILSLTVGVAYWVTVTTGAVACILRVGTAPFGATVGQFTLTANGSSEIVFVANATSQYLTLYSNSNASIGTIDNISVRELPGIHAIAASDAERPLLGRVPVTGRRNLLTYTEDFSNAAWAKANATLTANAAVAPDGTMTADTIQHNAQFSNVTQITSLPAGTYTASYWVRANTGTNPLFISYYTGVFVTGTSITPTSTWARHTFTFTSANPITQIVIAQERQSSGFGSYFIWGAQLETGSTATTYQKVVTALDVTEAGVADTYYVSFDGVNDYYSLLNAIPVTENMTVVRAFKRASAGIRAIGLGNTSATSPNDYAFAPDNTASASFTGVTPGNSIAADTSTGSFVSSTLRTAAGSKIIRRNGTQLQSESSGAVNGSFAALGVRSTVYNNGEISFLAVFPTELTGADLELIEQLAAATNGSVVFVWFLRNGWGATGIWSDAEAW